MTLRDLVISSTFLLLVQGCAEGALDEGAVPDDVAGEDLGKADDPSDPGGPDVLAAETIAADLEPAALAQDADHLYFVASVWSDEVHLGRTVYQVAKDGGAPVALVAPESIHYMAVPLAVSAGHVYWFVDDGDGSTFALRRVATAGGEAETVLEGVHVPLSIAADASGVYYAELVEEADWTYDVVRVAGGAATRLASDVAYPVALAFDAGHVYWADAGRGNPAIGCTPGEGTIGRVAKLGGVPRTLAFGQGCPMDLAVSGLAVYWTNWTATTIIPAGGPHPALMTVSTWGGLPRRRALGAVLLAADAGHVYWTSNEGALVRMPRLFGAPEVVDPVATQRPLVDGDHVYYWSPDAEGSRGSILRAPTD